MENKKYPPPPRCSVSKGLCGHWSNYSYLRPATDEYYRVPPPLPGLHLFPCFERGNQPPCIACKKCVFLIPIPDCSASGGGRRPEAEGTVPPVEEQNGGGILRQGEAVLVCIVETRKKKLHNCSGRARVREVYRFIPVQAPFFFFFCNGYFVLAAGWLPT